MSSMPRTCRRRVCEGQVKTAMSCRVFAVLEMSSVGLYQTSVVGVRAFGVIDFLNFVTVVCSAEVHQMFCLLTFLIDVFRSTFRRPLFAPCKCSGSIGLTHQDCLMSWLEVTRGDGKNSMTTTMMAL
jgi:hypothetical protein